MKTLTRFALVVLSLIAGCGNDGEDATDTSTATTTTSSSTTTTTTTTRPTSPLETFENRLRSRLTTDEGGYENLVNLAESVCRSMDAGEATRGDDASNDSPETDASIAESMATMTLDLVFDSLDPEPAAVFLRTTGEYLCPRHQETIESRLEFRNL